MIRYINCIRRKADISPEDFREYWNGAEFEDLVSKVATLTNALSHSKTLTLQVEMGQKLIADRGMDEPYDGVVEYHWDNANRLKHFYESPQAKQLSDQITRYQSQFIDLSRSTAFFTEDET